MDSVASIKSGWVFDKKGQVREVKKEQDRLIAKQVYNVAREALRYAPLLLTGTQKLRRIAFIKGQQEWLITMSHRQQITVLQKEQQV